MPNLPKHSAASLRELLGAMPRAELLVLDALFKSPDSEKSGRWSKSNCSDSYSIRYREDGQKNATVIGPRGHVEPILAEVLAGVEPVAPVKTTQKRTAAKAAALAAWALSAATMVVLVHFALPQVEVATEASSSKSIPTETIVAQHAQIEAKEIESVKSAPQIEAPRSGDDHHGLPAQTGGRTPSAKTVATSPVATFMSDALSSLLFGRTWPQTPRIMGGSESSASLDQVLRVLPADVVAALSMASIRRELSPESRTSGCGAIRSFTQTAVNGDTGILVKAQGIDGRQLLEALADACRDYPRIRVDGIRVNTFGGQDGLRYIGQSYFRWSSNAAYGIVEEVEGGVWIRFAAAPIAGR